MNRLHKRIRYFQHLLTKPSISFLTSGTGFPCQEQAEAALEEGVLSGLKYGTQCLRKTLVSSAKILVNVIIGPKDQKGCTEVHFPRAGETQLEKLKLLILIRNRKKQQYFLPGNNLLIYQNPEKSLDNEVCYLRDGALSQPKYHFL